MRFISALNVSYPGGCAQRPDASGNSTACSATRCAMRSPTATRCSARSASRTTCRPEFFKWWFEKSSDVPGTFDEEHAKIIMKFYELSKDISMIQAFPDIRTLVWEHALRALMVDTGIALAPQATARGFNARGLGRASVHVGLPRGVGAGLAGRAVLPAAGAGSGRAAALGVRHQRARSRSSRRLAVSCRRRDLDLVRDRLAAGAHSRTMCRWCALPSSAASGRSSTRFRRSAGPRCRSCGSASRRSPVVFAISAVLVPFALVNMSAGLANIDAETIEMAGSFTRKRARMFALVIVPSLYPFIFATLRIMFGVAWKVTLTAELFGGNSGAGLHDQPRPPGVRHRDDLRRHHPDHRLRPPAWTAMCSVPCSKACRATMPAEATSTRGVIAERLIGEGVVVAGACRLVARRAGLPEFILPGPVAVGRRLLELFGHAGVPVSHGGVGVAGAGRDRGRHADRRRARRSWPGASHGSRPWSRTASSRC